MPDHDVQIRLAHGPNGTYDVYITEADGGSGFGQFVAPHPRAIATFRDNMDPRRVRTRGPGDLDPAREFGENLLGGLLTTPSVRAVYTVARNRAHDAGHPLRVLLSLKAAPELASIPWEFLYESPWFLAQRSPVVRFVALENPPTPLRVEGPLRVLGMISRPKDDDLATLNAEQEQAALEERLRPLIDRGQVTLHWLPRATLQALHQEVAYGEDFHVFHYIGHGEFDKASRGSLILEHDDRRAHRVDGQRLGTVLHGRGSLRLAVLNTCETAQTAPQDPMAGVATSLMEFGVPAVVAMQFAITDDSALLFSDEFYRALAANSAVDAAITRARRALVAADANEWGTPVLFMSVADGQLFELFELGITNPTPPEPTPPNPTPPEPTPRSIVERIRAWCGAGIWRTVFCAAPPALVLVLLAGIVIRWSGDDHVVSTDWLDNPSARPVRYCSGKDYSVDDPPKGPGLHQRGVDDYNTRFAGAKAHFAEGPADANLQRKRYRQLIERNSKDCDVIFLDVIYMAEFVEDGLLYDMTPYLEEHDRKADYDDQMMKTVAYDGGFWGVPKQLDAGVLFYRKDRVRPPISWQDVYRQAEGQGAAGLGGLRLQRETNEGLTVVFLELLYAAGSGRSIISEDGKTANIGDEPAVLDAVMFLRNAIRDRVIPPTEPGLEGSLDVYERGRASFLRGWPFVASRIQDDAARENRARTGRETRIASLPPWRAGGQSFGVLGGHNLVIPRSAPNPSGALHFIDYLVGDEQVRKDEDLAAQYPVLKSVAEDENSLTNKSLMRAIRETNVLPRPTIPQYAAVSKIIALGVQCILEELPGDEGSVRSKLEQIDADVEEVLRSGNAQPRPDDRCA